MERVRNHAGANADSLPPPDGVDRYAVLRALDRERLAEIAPDVPRERRVRIAQLRDELRRGVFETPERLALGLSRALEEASRVRRRA
jgi:hypothetical protein